MTSTAHLGPSGTPASRRPRSLPVIPAHLLPTDLLALSRIRPLAQGVQAIADAIRPTPVVAELWARHADRARGRQSARRARVTGAQLRADSATLAALTAEHSSRSFLATLARLLRQMTDSGPAPEWAKLGAALDAALASIDASRALARVAPLTTRLDSADSLPASPRASAALLVRAPGAPNARA